MITLQLGFSYKYDFNDVIKDETHAVEVNGFGNDLIIRPNKKLQLKEIIKGKLIDKDKKLYDLGKDVAGFLSFEIKGNHGENYTILMNLQE